MRNSVVWFVVFLFVLLPKPGVAATLELYGTFEAMGVIVHLDSGDDPDENADVILEYRESGAGSFQLGYPPARVASLHFTGSLFWLQENTAYDVQVTFDDPGGTLHGVVLSGTESTRATPVMPVPAGTLFVSPAGTGSECSEMNPCSLATALAALGDGTEVVLLDGVYYAGGFTVTETPATTPVVLRSADSASPVLDGADPGAFTFSSVGSGMYHSILNTGDTHLVMADGERLYPYQTYNDARDLVWGISGFYCSGTDLYVHLLGDADPNLSEMVISRFNHAFHVSNSRDIFFSGITFRHYGQGSYAKAIYIDDSSDIVIQDCTFFCNDLGIGIKRDAWRNLIQNCAFSDTDFDWPWDAVKTGSGLETGGIRFYDPCNGRGNVIRRNTFTDYFDGFGVCPGSTTAVTSETDVYENTVYMAGDDGMETDGECTNVRIWNNRFEEVLVGISVAPVYTGPVYCIRNLIFKTGAGNNSYPGSPFKFNSGYGLSGPMYLFHNTSDAVNPGNHGLDIKAPGTWTNVVARNNIWSGTDYAMRNYNTSNPVDMDYDCVYTSGGGTWVYWNSTHYPTLSAFTTATGQEPNGWDDAPAFRNAAGGDYRLVSGSSLVDQGCLLPGINNDFSGTAPDPGAFEDPGPAVPALLPAGPAVLILLLSVLMYRRR